MSRSGPRTFLCPPRVFLGWSEWRWAAPADDESSHVLIGVDPRERAWSIGEVGPTARYGVLVGPRGDLLTTVDGSAWWEIQRLLEHEVRIRGGAFPVSTHYPPATWRGERFLRGWKQVDLARRIWPALRARMSVSSLQVRLSVAENSGQAPDFLLASVEHVFRGNPPVIIQRSRHGSGRSGL